MTGDVALTAVRLDIWLWAARFFRTRSLAKQAIEVGRVEVDGQRAKPSRVVRTGERLQVTRGEEVFAITVRGLSEQRGPASVAQTLYVEDPESIAARAETRAAAAAARAGYTPPEGRPDKRARRLIRALGDIDAL
ncbi:RNA-binding S4 domain-containing protein [Solilutibacter silvestris]|uniref:RNA-binding S4 domain-containing protein n=1 Tax=Solilutibacter silvestris TaxID=1645665 RepID=UPI003D356738